MAIGLIQRAARDRSARVANPGPAGERGAAAAVYVEELIGFLQACPASYGSNSIDLVYFDA